MFSFQLNDELVFRRIPSSSSISFQQPATNQQKEIAGMEGTNSSSSNKSVVLGKARKRHGDPSSSSSSSKPNSTTNEGVVVDDFKEEINTQRKLVHKQIERQRRQDMAKLYASLRGLLPLEFVKGKRSTSDHMHQAVKYIKDMQENIKVLNVKRDKLKKIVEKCSNHGTTTSSKKSSILVNHNVLPYNNNGNNNTVSVSYCDHGGIQILINSCLLEEGFPLSRVLKSISKDGHLNVNTFTCTRVSNRLLHSIQIDEELVNDATSTDLPLLQQKLTAIANNNY
uniref:transcription factor bHLH118-like n=1 Tax=Erigeron canadensis TaxID=72917 RepID=UPI001CB9BFA3|nr:transcription factor bHLH118-like [Erigeron canadensis]